MSARDDAPLLLVALPPEGLSPATVDHFPRHAALEAAPSAPSPAASRPRPSAAPPPPPARLAGMPSRRACRGIGPPIGGLPGQLRPGLRPGSLLIGAATGGFPTGFRAICPRSAPPPGPLPRRGLPLDRFASQGASMHVHHQLQAGLQFVHALAQRRRPLPCVRSSAA